MPQFNTEPSIPENVKHIRHKVVKRIIMTDDLQLIDYISVIQHEPVCSHTDVPDCDGR